MSLFRIAYMRRLFEHRSRTALSISGVAIGAALVVTVAGMFGSLSGSVDSFTRGLAGTADLEVGAVSDDGLDASVFFKVRDVQGVRSAVPVVHAHARVVGPRSPRGVDTLIVGVDERARQLSTQIGRAVDDDTIAKAAADPSVPGLVITRRIAQETGAGAGDTVGVVTGAGSASARVIAVLKGDAAQLNEGRFAAAPLPVAQVLLSRPNKIDSIFVIVDRGVEVSTVQRRLASAAGDQAAVDSPAHRAREAQQATRGLRYGMLMAVAMALVVGGFLMFNTMNMAALERRRELATMRALGGKRAHLLASFLLEAAMIGAVGGLAGVAVGYFVAGKLVRSVPDFFVAAVGVELGFHMPYGAIPAGVGASVLVAVVAAFVPALRAVTVPPVESMKPEGVLESVNEAEGVSLVPTFLGAAMMVGGFTSAMLASGSLGYIGIAVLMTGAIVLSYGCTYYITSVTARAIARFGTAGRLAAAAIERSPRRAWASSVAVVTAVGMVVAQTSITSNLDRSLRTSLRSLGKVDLYVSAQDPSSLGGLTQLPGDWGTKLGEIPGVSHVGTSTLTFFKFRKQKVLLQGVSRSLGAEPAMAGITPSERALVERGQAAVVSERFTQLYGIGDGDVLTLATNAGSRRIPVVGSVRSFAWERGLVTINRELMGEWFGTEGVSDYLLTFQPGADAASVRRSVKELVERLSTGNVFVTSGSDYLTLIFGAVGQINRLFYLLAGVVVAAAILAVLNALLISVLERRRELGIMRAIGTSRRQIRVMVAFEAGALGVIGGLFGIALGLLTHRAAIAAISKQGGVALTYELVLGPAVLALGVGAAVAVAGSLQPARRASRINIIEAIGYE